jgi:HEAT repeat protein
METRIPARHAAKALAKFEDPRVLPALVEAITRHSADEFAAALVRLGREAIEPLAAALGAAEPEARSRIARILGEIGDRGAVKPLLAMFMGDQNGLAREDAAEALGRLRANSAVDVFIASLKSDPAPRVVRALGEIGDERAVKPLIRLLHHQNPSVRLWAADSLGKIGRTGTANSIAPLLNDSGWEVPEYAAKAMAVLGDSRGIVWLIGSGMRAHEQLTGNDSSLWSSARDRLNGSLSALEAALRATAERWVSTDLRALIDFIGGLESRHLYEVNVSRRQNMKELAESALRRRYG